MKFKLALTLFLISILGFSQNKGTITGTLTDKNVNNDPLPFANVILKETTIGATTDEKGKYSITVAAGSYVLQFSFVGYENIEEKIEVKAGETIIMNKALGSGSYQLRDVVIQNTVNREKETTLLLEQKKSVVIKPPASPLKVLSIGFSRCFTNPPTTKSSLFVGKNSYFKSVFMLSLLTSS